MARNYYSEINLHLTWHTKTSLPLLTPRVEPLAHRCVRQKIAGTEGVFLHEIGGTETHVHIVVTIAPTILISEFVGQVKGASSHEVNRELGLRDKTLEWQSGYGVVSFGTGDLEWVKGYVRDQRQHHAQGKLWFIRLKRTWNGTQQFCLAKPCGGSTGSSSLFRAEQRRGTRTPAPGCLGLLWLSALRYASAG